MSKMREHLHGPTHMARAEYRYGLVLILLLATFVLLMAGSTSEWARVTSVALTGATLVAALYAAGTSVRLRRLAILGAVLAFVAVLSVVAFGRSGAASAAMLNGALVALAPIVIARSVMRRRIVDVQTILAALCIYVLLGMLWAFAYTAMAQVDDAPFFAQSLTPTSADFLYFSFITQTTVGYGDLSAAGNFGRACAVLEALIGQIYLVTIVALLVSRLVPRDATRPPKPENS
jgi:drug/metabolite transporter (DMT)-like permease